jgi:hypothetical protein
LKHPNCLFAVSQLLVEVSKMLVAVSQLNAQRPQLFAQQVHCLEEFRQLALAIHQHFLVRDDLLEFRVNGNTGGVR